MTSKHRLCFALIFLGLLLPLPVQAQLNPTRLPFTEEHLADSLRTDWYGIYLGDKKIGYAKSEMTTHKDGDKLTYRVISDMKAKVKSMGQPFEMDIFEVMEFSSQAPYNLVAARELQIMGPARQEITLSPAKRGFQVVTKINGKETIKLLAKIDFSLADLLTPSVWVMGKVEKGDIIARSSFSFERLKLEPVEYELLETKTSLVKGVPVTFHEIKIVYPGSKTTSQDLWDSEGNMLSSKIDGVFELRMETEEQAKNLDSNTDLFAMGIVKIDKAIGNDANLTCMIVEVVGNELESLQSSSWQTVVKTDKGQVLCKVGKKYATRVKATAREIDENLEATTTYPVTHPRIQELASRAIGNAKTPQEKVKRLVDFVHRYIRPSLHGKGFLVLDLLDKKAGDCTAYASMFTTLARAAGIPAREVDGLMYMGDSQKSFGGHAWNEVIIDGHWHPVDASTGQFEVSAARIAFGTDSRGGLLLLKNSGQLSFRLVEVER
jgi:hypothetical protein